MSWTGDGAASGWVGEAWPLERAMAPSDMPPRKDVAELAPAIKEGVMANGWQELVLDLQNVSWLASVCLALLGGALALMARRVFSRRRWPVASAAALLVAMAVAPLTARAIGPLPFIFGSGTVADADELNANFDHLLDGIQDVEDQLSGSTTRTRTLIIPAHAFRPASSTDTSWVLSGTLRRTVAGAGTFFAPVYLPSGSTITSLTAYVFDTNTAAGNSIQVQLLRFGNASFSIGALAGFPSMSSDTIDPTDNMDALTQTASHVVNDLQALMVRVILNGTTVEFNNVVIEYETTEL